MMKDNTPLATAYAFYAADPAVFVLNRVKSRLAPAAVPVVPEANRKITKTTNADADSTTAAPTTIDVSTWLANMSRAEKIDGCDYNIHKRSLIASVVELDHFNNAGGMQNMQDMGADKLKIEVSDGAFKKITQDTVGDVKFKLWGKVVEGYSAASVTKQHLLPLGISDGVALFLDGSHVSNPNRTNACLGWLLQQHAIKNDDEKLDCDAAPAVKKPKKQPKKEPKPITHKLVWEPFEVSLTIDGRIANFTYNKPSLAPNTECDEELRLNVACSRAAFDWKIEENSVYEKYITKVGKDSKGRRPGQSSFAMT